MKIKQTKIITCDEFLKDMPVEIKRISNWIEKTDSPSDALHFFILNLINECSGNYYEDIGIITEILFEIRQELEEQDN